MEIRLIIIGDELLSGQIADKNGQYLGKFLHKKGIELKNIKIVGDHEVDLTSAFKGFDGKITLVCGGLGPTHDDKTKKVMASFFNLEILESDACSEIVEKNYSRRGVSWDPDSNFYHHIPKSVTPLNNPSGLAPGLALIKDDFAFICLPGVPIEFNTMLEEVVFPLLEKSFKLGNKDLGRINIKTFGIPEESIFHKNKTLWQDLSMFGKVASLPHALGVDIEISRIDLNKHPNFSEKIKDLLGPLKENVWQYGDNPLEERVIDLAREKNLMIGLAESCTGGLISHRLTNVDGCSSHFLGSIVSYADEVKRDILAVKEETLNSYGAVSLEIAREMAIGAADKLKADITVSVTGIAGPAGGSEEKPVGTVAIGYCYQGESGSELLNLRGNRKNLKYLFSQKALFTLFFLLRDGRL
ncbi:MAG: nicotinamide-nucleotide amidohydrolase family protein [Deltaproteobacteria bacterium]|nr:MAG: nicotinamide-nucleotide amidohydrolase family protein [Deltaproteobacteria bacterium]